MYHVKKDARARKSAELLYGALVEALESKGIDEVSVTELSNRSSVGRTTFYRNFDETIDILHWKCDQQFREVMVRLKEAGPSESEATGLLLCVLRYWMGHSLIIELLLKMGRVDIIYYGFLDNANAIMIHLEEEDKGPVFPEPHLFMAVRAGYFIGIMDSWITDGKKRSAEEYAEIIQNQEQLVSNAPVIF